MKQDSDKPKLTFLQRKYKCCFKWKKIDQDQNKIPEVNPFLNEKIINNYRERNMLNLNSEIEQTTSLQELIILTNQQLK